jgi:hypothetical protein
MALSAVIAAALLGSAQAFSYNQLDSSQKAKIQTALSNYGISASDPASIELQTETFSIDGTDPTVEFELVQDTGSYGHTTGWYYTSNPSGYSSNVAFVQNIGGSGASVGDTAVKTVSRNTELGFYIYVPDTGNTFFSEGFRNQANGDVSDHTLVFTEGLKTVVCFEDLENQGDADFSDVCLGFTAGTSGGGGGGGDPHFVGFNGESYDFFGMPNAVFNLISTPVFQINSHFASMLNVADNTPRTLMDKIAFVADGHDVVIDSNGAVTVDGEAVHTGSKTVISENFSVHLSHHTENLISHVPSAKAEEWYGNVGHEASLRLAVTLYDMEFFAYVVSTPRMPGLQFLDFQVGTLPESVTDMHGIIGQTAQGTLEQRGLYEPVVGNDVDYIVRDGLTGKDFAYNLYN